MICLPIFVALSLVISNQGASQFPCGQKKRIQRAYGTVVQKVDCEISDEYKFVSEYKGKMKHGISMRFNKRFGWKKDSALYQSDLQEGTRLAWDSAGNIIQRNSYWKGKQVGRQEGYWEPGKPQFISNFNDSGKEDGLQSEWWRNGKKKSEIVSKDGEILSGTEYYPSGHPRVTYVIKPNPSGGVFGIRYISAASWAPDGRPTGQVVNGTGNFMLWAAEPGKSSVVHQEFHKDTSLVTVKELDSAQVENWFRVNSSRR